MTSQHAHPRSAPEAADGREHFIRAGRSHLIDEMNVDVPNEAAAPIGDGEMTRWACIEQARNAALVPDAAAVPIARDVNARPLPLEPPAARAPASIKQRVPVAATAPKPDRPKALVWPLVIAAAVLLLFAGGSLGAVMLGSLVLVAPAVIFAVLAVLVLLAAIPGVQVRFSSKFCSFSLETRIPGETRENSAANGG